MINGRSADGKNDFTSFNAKGQSVVDYCIAPHDSLNAFSDFTITKPQALFEEAGLVGSYDPSRTIPNHALLSWEIEMPFLARCTDEQKKCNFKEDTIRKHDVSDIPGDFMGCNTVTQQINECITKLEHTRREQEELDATYRDLCEIIHDEMDNELPVKTITISEGPSSNKKCKVRKPWWNDTLTELLNKACEAEKDWRSAEGREKKRLMSNMKTRKQSFDKATQSNKRRYWQSQQEDLLKLNEKQPKDFWNYIGKLGVAHGRSTKIPFELVNPDGHVSREPEVVME